jgi:hypothetical protein
MGLLRSRRPHFGFGLLSLKPPASTTAGLPERLANANVSV